MHRSHKALLKTSDLSSKKISILVYGYLHQIRHNDLIPTIIYDICYCFYKYIQCYGELFDLFYYTTKLKDKLIRTYFHELVSEIENIHKNNIFIGNLRPEYLFLNNKYSVKIVPYLLSHLSRSIQPYIAPEILSNNNNLSNVSCACDIFSLGVILFILFCGYPPFEQASKSCKWYKPLIKNDTQKFWKYHCNSRIVKESNITIKNLLTKMFRNDPTKRISIKLIKKHIWYNADIYHNSSELTERLRRNYIKIEQKRRKDAYDSWTPWDIADYSKTVNINYNDIELFPINEIEGIFDVYSFCNKDYDIYNTLNGWIRSKLKGNSIYDYNRNILVCTIDGNNKDNNSFITNKIGFQIKVYQSIEWKNRKYQYKDIDDNINDINELEDVFIIRISRINGDSLTFNKVKNYILRYCVKALKGLPSWARKLLEYDKLQKYNK